MIEQLNNIGNEEPKDLSLSNENSEASPEQTEEQEYTTIPSAERLSISLGQGISINLESTSLGMDDLIARAWEIRYNFFFKDKEDRGNPLAG